MKIQRWRCISLKTRLKSKKSTRKGAFLFPKNFASGASFLRASGKINLRNEYFSGMIVFYVESWLQTVLLAVQIFFYSAIPILAFFSFMVAKKNLATPVKVEYLKLTIQRLHHISEQLSEFLSKQEEGVFGKQYWKWMYEHSKRRDEDPNHSVLAISIHLQKVLPDHQFEELLWLDRFRKDIDTDPFVPYKLREAMKSHISKKVNDFPNLLADGMNSYFQFMDNPNPEKKGSLSSLTPDYSDFIEERLIEHGYSMKKDEKIIQFRETIREELESLTKS